MMVVRRIKIVWTCSDYVHHEHTYKLCAWVCGKIQYLRSFIRAVAHVHYEFVWWFPPKLYFDRFGGKLAEKYVWALCVGFLEIRKLAEGGGKMIGRKVKGPVKAGTVSVEKIREAVRKAILSSSNRVTSKGEKFFRFKVGTLPKICHKAKQYVEAEDGRM